MRRTFLNWMILLDWIRPLKRILLPGMSPKGMISETLAVFNQSKSCIMTCNG